MSSCDKKEQISNLLGELIEGPINTKIDQLAKEIGNTTGTASHRVKLVGQTIDQVQKHVKSIQESKLEGKEDIEEESKLESDLRLLGKRQIIAQKHTDRSAVLSLDLNNELIKQNLLETSVSALFDLGSHRNNQMDKIKEYFKDKLYYMQDARYKERVRFDSLEYFMLIDAYVQRHA